MKKYPMNYEEARAYIENSGSGRGNIELGLEQIRVLLLKLQQPEQKLKYIHIAGTNGKGSIGAFLTSILAESGYRVGRFLSPVIFDYREQIQVIEKKCDSDSISYHWITEDSIIKHVKEISIAVKEMEDAGQPLPSPFELETAMAFLEFAEKQCDIVILEVGMGGRLDATNIIESAECTVIASISMDHMAFLGNTLTEIAREKVGILKPSVPVVSDIQEEEVECVIKEEAKRQCANLTVIRKDQIQDIRYGEKETSFIYRDISYQISLLGENQVNNAVVAIECIHALQKKNDRITVQAIRNGLRKAEWMGRFQRMKEHPVLIADGAHNEGAARSLRASIEIYFKDRTIFYIIGMLADKECDKVLEITAGYAKEIFTITPPNPRALSSLCLAEKARKYCEMVWNIGDTETAVREAFKRAGSDDVIIAFGSLSFLGELSSCLRKL